ncbi:MAG: DUF4433 domain-containing protein [Pseudomonadota bacterium]
MPIPIPTPIFRFVHIGNLDTILRHEGMFAFNSWPDDELPYIRIYDQEIQEVRSGKRVTCGAGGVINDYIAFYFGYLSPMMLRLKTGRVEGFHDGQEPLIYLVSTAQKVVQKEIRFVFSDGHGIANLTNWYDDLSQLDKVDWDMVYERYWADKTDTLENMDRQRRKQAEFLICDFCPWDLIDEIAVINQRIKFEVEGVLANFSVDIHRPVAIRRDWYYH